MEIILIVGSFGVLAYFQSQQSSLGNSINIAGKKLKFTFPVSGNSVHMYGMTELPQLIEASKQIEPGIRDSPETSYWPAPYPNMKFLPGFLGIVLLC